MKKTIGHLIVIVYVIVAIAVTLCLLSYNEYKVTEFGENTLIIINDNSLEPNYKEGDLVIVNGENIDNITEGQKIFFYNNKDIKLGEVKKVSKYQGVSSTFILDGDHQVLEDDVIGSENDAKAYGTLGKVLSVLESKWGFMFLIIFPSLMAFLYEIFQVVTELKNKKD